VSLAQTDPNTLTHACVRVRALLHTHAHITRQSLDETALVAGIKSGTAQTSSGRLDFLVMSELLAEFDNHEVSVYACMFVHGAPCLYIAHVV
jgi:hypothetical protein